MIPSGSQHKQEAFDFIAVRGDRSRRDAVLWRQRVFNLLAAQECPGHSISNGPALQAYSWTSANGPNAHVFPRLGFAA